MLQTGFETTILASEQPQTHAIDRSATGIGSRKICPPPTPSKCKSFMSYVKLVKVNKEWEGVDWINVAQDKWLFCIRQ